MNPHLALRVRLSLRERVEVRAINAYDFQNAFGVTSSRF